MKWLIHLHGKYKNYSLCTAQRLFSFYKNVNLTVTGEKYIILPAVFQYPYIIAHKKQP